MKTRNSPPGKSVKTKLILGISLILGLLFDYFFYGKIPGLAFPLYIILILGGLFAIAGFLKKRVNGEVFWLLVPLIFFSLMVFIRASFLLTFLNIIASMLLLLVIAEIFSAGSLRNFLINDYLKIFFLPFRFVRSLFQRLSDLFSLSKRSKNGGVWAQIVKGVLITIPVLFIFLFLFSSADLVLQKYIGIILKPETVFRSVLVLLVALVFAGAYFYSFQKEREKSDGRLNDKKFYFGRIEASILFGSVNLLFLIFILIQLTYLFGSESNISVQGFTYAEYARHGFFELIFVAVISLFLLLVTEKYVFKKEAGHALWFKILSSWLVIQVVLIMISAFTRLSLYEEAYGFTMMRLYSHSFIILLAVIFFLLLYKIHRNKKENFFAAGVFVSLVLFLMMMNFFNPDVFIARQNIRRFGITGKIDIPYLSSLSDDAAGEMVKALEILDEDSKKELAGNLYRRMNDSSPFLSGWQSLNISRLKAGKILNSKIDLLEQYKNYQEPSR